MVNQKDSSRFLGLIRQLDLLFHKKKKLLDQSQDRDEIQKLERECRRICEEKIKIAKQFERQSEKCIQYSEDVVRNLKKKLGIDVQKIEITENLPIAQNTQENEQYCICTKIADTEPMIKCDNINCKNQWYHFSCLNLSKQEVEANDQWFCQFCKPS